MTDRARHIVVVKEYGDGVPWLMLELLEGEELPVLRRGFLGLDLRQGTTYEEAQALANSLNELLAYTTYTHSWDSPATPPPRI
jgi:hypothetical protein